MILKKDDQRFLTSGLTHDDFKCQCSDCFTTIINPKLINSFNKLQEGSKGALKVISGYNCPEYNRENIVNDEEALRHVTGSEIDLDLKILINDFGSTRNIKSIAKFCEFNYIKIDEEKNIIHLAVRSKHE